ncbi:MAG: hypothetical protein K8R69_00375 [Deltaproteobacteria bacterium]|nr:hypothetical protein [Deltaproteobacteria bacterium]
MARKKSKKKTKQSPQLWQWVIVAGAAFLLYQGLQHFLQPGKKAPEKKIVAVKGKSEKPGKESPPPAKPKPTPAPTPMPTPQVTAAPVTKWDFKNAGRFLPKEAYPDNYTALPSGNSAGLLAYAKIVAGKKPGPQGLTNTEPGLRAVVWDGKKSQSQDLDFHALQPALGGLKLVGPPQPERKPWISDGATIYPVKLFLNDETRLMVAFVRLEGSQLSWAPVAHEEGKTSAAAFLQGTTAAVTRRVNKVEHDGKHYIVVEKGSLDLTKPEAGYQWKVEAYAWNGKAFAFDKAYSAALTKEKKSAEQ